MCRLSHHASARPKHLDRFWEALALAPQADAINMSTSQLVWMEYGLHGRIIGRSAMPSVEDADGNTDRADDRAVFSWTRTATTCLLGLSEDLRLCARGPRPSIDTAALLTGPSTISMTSTDWGLQRSAVSSTVELAGIFGVIWTQSSTRATTCQVPHTRGSLFLPSTATCQDCAPARSKYCCGARQISRIAIPPVRNRPWCY